MPSPVAVIIPVYNGERFLADAITSAFAQDCELEVIVVDDGSTDASGQIARDLGATCIRQHQQGPAAARNTGIAATAAPLLSFVDADDMFTPGSLRAQLDHLARNPSAAGVIGRQTCEIVDDVPLPAWAVADGIGGPDPAHRHVAMSLLAHRSAFERVGGFDPYFVLSQDVDWLFRAKDMGLQIDTIDDIVRVRRIHRDNRTNDDAATRRWMFEVLGARARRKRSPG